MRSLISMAIGNTQDFEEWSALPGTGIIINSDDPRFDNPIVKGTITKEGKSAADSISAEEIMKKTECVAELYNEGKLQREIAEAVGLRQSSVCYHIKRGKELGLITEGRQAGKRPEVAEGPTAEAKPEAKPEAVVPISAQTEEPVAEVPAQEPVVEAQESVVATADGELFAASAMEPEVSVDYFAWEAQRLVNEAKRAQESAEWLERCERIMVDVVGLIGAEGAKEVAAILYKHYRAM